MNLRQEFKEVESYSGDRPFPSHFRVSKEWYKSCTKGGVRVRQKYGGNTGSQAVKTTTREDLSNLVQ
jgi:hypothetical protein